MQHAGNFVAKYDDDDQGGGGDDALHGPAGDDQAHVDRQALDHPEHGNGHDHPDHIGAPEKDVKPEEDIAVEQDVNDVLPAQPGVKWNQWVHGGQSVMLKRKVRMSLSFSSVTSTRHGPLSDSLSCTLVNEDQRGGLMVNRFSVTRLSF